MRVVERVASRFVRRLFDSERDDVVSDGMLVLERAVRDWEEDPAARERFGGSRNDFLAGRVKRGMIDGIRQRNGSTESGYPRQRFRHSILSYDRIDVDGGRENLLERVGGELDRDLENVGVVEMLDGLPPREREVIERSVFGGETEMMIAKDFGVGESRISQIRSQGLSRLRGENAPMPKDEQENAELTNRQVEVLQAIANDRTNTEIARELHVSEETVKSHVRHILRRFGCRSRAGAVAAAFRTGLIV